MQKDQFYIKEFPLISASELKAILHQHGLILVDASAGPTARKNYNEKHVDGALFVDLNNDLAKIETDVSIGGRHPLPPLVDFEKTLSSLGITPQSHVVIYDDKHGSIAAARFWWMLKAVGHEKVQVLNGGLQAAEIAGFQMNSNPVTIQPSHYELLKKWNLPLAAIAEVGAVAKKADKLIVDVREAGRYRGEVEPIDLIAGHIPGAINIPFSENLDDNGHFLSPALLKTKYESLLGNIRGEDVTVHCGSGVTACHTVLAMVAAGLEFPKLYVGSWSEWSRSGREMTLSN